MKSVEKKILFRIYGLKRGSVFSKNDFLDLGGDSVVRKALSNLEAKGTIRRVLRGLYDYPRVSELLGETLGPDLDQVAQALARKSGWRIQATGNMALNALGLSTQVPAKAVYLSDGPSKRVSVGQREIVFKQKTLKETGFKHRESERVVQALKSLGRDRVDADTCRQLVDRVPASAWSKMVRDTRTAPAWIHEIIREIAEKVAT